MGSSGAAFIGLLREAVEPTRVSGVVVRRDNGGAVGVMNGRRWWVGLAVREMKT